MVAQQLLSRWSLVRVQPGLPAESLASLPIMIRTGSPTATLRVVHQFVVCSKPGTQEKTLSLVQEVRA